MHTGRTSRRSPRTLRGWVALAATLAVIASLASPALAALPATAGEAASIRNLPFQPAVGPPTADGVGLVDPTQGLWYLRNAAGATTTFFYGNPADFPIMGDWDCNGTDTPGMYRQSDGFVYLRNSNTAGIGDIRFFFGDPSDVPLAGDFNGDGCDTVSIYRSAEQRFYIINKLGANEGGLGAAEFSFLFGNPGDKPVVGDWDGDGIDEVGLHRESTGFFYFRNALSTGIASGEFFFGDPADRFVAGDWGVVDGVDTPAIFRPSDARVYFRFSNSPGFADRVMAMGKGPWLPVAGDFGPLSPRISASISGAPAGLANAVASVYSWRSAAPYLPTGLRNHLANLSTFPAPAAFSGTAKTASVRGSEVATVVVGNDVLVAVRDPEWRVVGAKLGSMGKSAWYGGSPRRVLVLGSDAKPGDIDPTDNNADAVQLLSVVPATGQAVVANLPRDTFVNASYGLDKVAITLRNKGTGQPFGPTTTLTAVSGLTGLSIEGYMVTGFVGYEGLVDDFGGFVSNLFYAIPNIGGPGSLLLDGPDALLAARERVTLPNGDVDRTLNQGDQIVDALAKVKAMGVLSVPALLDLLDNYVITSLSAEQLVTLGAAAFDLGAVPNIVVEGDVTAKVLRGVQTFGFELDAANAAVWQDLSDGVLQPGACPVATSRPTADTGCWRRK